MAVERLNIRELNPHEGDTRKQVALMEAIDLEYKLMVTSFPNGEIAHSFDELLQISSTYPGPEVDVFRFPIMAGG